MAQCSGTAEYSGQRCRRHAPPNEAYCYWHEPVRELAARLARPADRDYQRRRQRSALVVPRRSRRTPR